MSVSKTVLITGITKGIGRSLAELFAANGFNVAGCARNEKEINVFTAELWNTYENQRFLIASVDVSDKIALQAFRWWATRGYQIKQSLKKCFHPLTLYDRQYYHEHKE